MTLYKRQKKAFRRLYRTQVKCMGLKKDSEFKVTVAWGLHCIYYSALRMKKILNFYISKYKKIFAYLAF
jgi:hypothetical protein